MSSGTRTRSYVNTLYEFIAYVFACGFLLLITCSGFILLIIEKIWLTSPIDVMFAGLNPQNNSIMARDFCCVIADEGAARAVTQ